tara:strand:+ start:70 stop:369 length:300 start_codon:yes stop_codon:yes gene_type:complete
MGWISRKKFEGRIFYDESSYIKYLQSSRKWFNSYKPWTKNDHDILIDLVGKGYTNAQIGRKMFRVTGGIKSRVRLLVNARLLVDNRGKSIYNLKFGDKA